MSKDNAPDLAVSNEIKELAARIEKDLKIGEGGTVAVEKDFYQSLLPDNISIADVNRIQAHDANLISAVGLALGNVATKHMAKNKGLDDVAVKFKAGKNEIAMGFSRSKTSRDVRTGDAVVRHGVLNAKVTVAGAKNSAGSWKTIRTYLSDRGADQLG